MCRLYIYIYIYVYIYIFGVFFLEVAVGQNRFGIPFWGRCSKPILEPILVWIGMFTGARFGFWPMAKLFGVSMTLQKRGGSSHPDFGELPNLKGSWRLRVPLVLWLLEGKLEGTPPILGVTSRIQGTFDLIGDLAFCRSNSHQVSLGS